MIHFFTASFATAGNGPSKFARALRSYYPQNELTVYTPDTAATVGPGVRSLPAKPRWLVSSLAYFVFEQRVAHRALRGQALSADEDVLAFNNVLSGASLYRSYDLPTLGFVNDDNNLRYRETSRSRAQRLQRFLLRGRERVATSDSTLTIVNSDYLKRQVVRAYGLAPERVEVLYKGVDVAQFGGPFLPPPASAKEPLRVLFVKSDWRRGNLTTVIRAVERVAKSRQIVLRIAGCAAEDYPSPVPNGLCEFLGVVPAETVRAELQRAHVFCTPALYEALGVANMEAMLSRTPVIASDVGGIPEVTGHGRYAIQVSPRDVDGIAAALLRLCANPAETEARVRAARDFVRENFSIERSMKRFGECCQHARERFGALHQDQ